MRSLPSFNENVGLVLHYNQALLDILDDWEDIEDDVCEDMPNIFVMAAVEKIPYHEIKVCRPELIRKIAMNGTNISGGSVNRLVNYLHASSKSVSVPESLCLPKNPIRSLFQYTEKKPVFRKFMIYCCSILH